ncbi:signal recognition particle subunit SRP72-like [Lineus longissimus]|uniref:signal recognition particle subunit SRP72-like n=1 Tax=Lineus longissimus TaxID=88925 RepID=UPI002B4F5FA4
MAQPKEVNLQAFFAELNKYGQNQEYDRALKVANKILQEVHDDEEAFHCKIVCLIHLNRFEDVLTQIRKNPKISGVLMFEKAYCEYRLNRTRDALVTLRFSQSEDLRLKELMAQVLYRLEEYDECYEVYKDLVKHSMDDFEYERETNMSAVMAALQQWTDNDMGDETGLREETFELCYNNACFLIGRGLYKQAEAKLREAEDLCRKTLEEDQDVTEEEIESELGIIHVQLGYAIQCQNRMEEALKLYNQVVKSKPSDSGLAAVASNNIVSINKDQNVFDSKKKIKVATADNLGQKLTREQKKVIELNQCLLFMYMNQGDQCKRTAKNLEAKYPDLDNPILIQAGQLCREKQTNKAAELLQKKVDDSPECSIQIKLTLAQLYLQQQHWYKACNVLKTMGDLSYKPGVVSALVTLYLNGEDEEAASQVLISAVNWYKENDPDSDELIALMRANANFQLKHGSPKEATTMLEELRRRDPKDMKTLAQLISAYSKFDAKKAQLISKDLPSLTEMATDVDVAALESTVSNLTQKYVKKSTKIESPRPGSHGDELIQKKNRKKKKGKLPKNLDGETDPERWLPKRERSYYRGKRKDKRKDIGKGPQGAASGGADAYDASKPAAPSPSASGSDVGSPRPGQAQAGSSSAPAPQGPRQQKPAAASSKKKKKGKSKW